MDEIIRQAIIAMRSMWRYRLLALASAWGLGILGIAGVMLIPSKYEAAARMFVNTESILRPLMAGMTVAPDMNQRIEILSRVLISRPNVEKLIKTAGLDAKLQSREEIENRIDELIKNLQVRGTGRDQIYTITLRDGDPVQAKRLVEQFTALFFESGQGNRELDTDVAKKFINQQVAAYEKKLEEAEGRLKEFRMRHPGLRPGQGGDFFARMTEAGTLLERAQLELREAEQSREALRRRLTELETGNDGTPAPSGPDPRIEITTRIESAKKDLSLLLLRYTDAHPDVVGMRRVIKELEAKLAELPEVRRKDPAPAAVATGQLNVTLAQSEANIASLRARVAEYTARESKLKESALQMPQLDAEFAQLNRDYDVNKRGYESLLTRRESVVLSGDMQSAAGAGDFKLIDPPRVSPQPVAPNRPLLLGLALVFALAGGAAAAYGATMTHPAFYDVRGLREATQLPVLGTIMKASGGRLTPERKKRIIRFLAGVGALIVLYAGFIVMTALTLRSPK